MPRLAAAFAKAVILLFVTIGVQAVQAAALEVPLRGTEKISISVPEAVISLQANPQAKTLRVNLGDAAAEEYSITSDGTTLLILPKEPVTKENFGQFQPKKRIIEIQGPALPVEIHAFEGQVQLTKWSREALVHVQKGRIVSREGTGSLLLHSQNGEIQVLDHQGRLDVDAYKSSVVVKELTGDADIENFSGETTIDKAKGFLSLNQGQGSTKVTGSSGTVQFELAKGVLNIQNFQGRVEGQTQEGPVTVNMAAETEVSLKSQSGRVTVQAPPNSGASLNLTTQEGDIVVPNYLKVNRDGSQKTLRARLKGENQKGSVLVRSQEGSIIIR
jgi:DUF4097 and DUF4098 domain-containing protein YvlB